MTTQTPTQLDPRFRKKYACALALVVSACTVSWAQSPSPSSAGPERTVRDVHSLLGRVPDELIDKTIVLGAYVLEQVQVRTMNPEVTRCSNYLILVDPDAVVEQRFRALRWDARAPFLRTIPHILTTEVTPGGKGGAILPSRRAVYRGRVVRTTCPENRLRFQIEEKVKEMAVTAAPPSVSPTPSPAAAAATADR